VASEELEKSLRAEVEKHVSDRMSELQHELAVLQERVSEELSRLHTSLFEQIGSLKDRFSDAGSTSEGIAMAITDHLRSARKQGMEEAATESPAMQTGSSLAILKSAIVDVTAQTSQAAILKTLVNNSAAFAPRVVFFIVKNDHLIGWRARGLEGTVGDEAAKEIAFPLMSETVLSDAADSHASWSGQPGQYPGDHRFLDKLGGPLPHHAAAIPLIARGRAVAVLYADSGDLDAESVNLEALESLVRVTGMAVELLAASGHKAPAPGAPHEVNESYRDMTAPATTAEAPQAQAYAPAYEPAPAPAYEPPPAPAYVPPAPEPEPTYEPAVEMEHYDDTMAPEPTTAYAVPDTSYSSFDTATEAEEIYATPVEAPAASYEADAWAIQPEAAEYEVVEAEPVVHEIPVHAAAPAPAQSGAAAEATARAARSWARDTELPIDVPEDERKVHNDARRFARLLVSEIKLYNEQKVVEGRQAGDIYRRLQEAIDRSREMYDKRVAPVVADRYDYFYHEVVNTLAEGDNTKMGHDFPAASV
jgi:hypothetical protein